MPCMRLPIRSMLFLMTLLVVSATVFVYLGLQLPYPHNLSCPLGTSLDAVPDCTHALTTGQALLYGIVAALVVTLVAGIILGVVRRTRGNDAGR